MNKQELRTYIKLLDLDIAELIERRNEAVAEFQKPGYFALARAVFKNNPNIRGNVEIVDIPEDECVGVAIAFGNAYAHWFEKQQDIFDIRAVRWNQNFLLLSVHFK